MDSTKGDLTAFSSRSGISTCEPRFQSRRMRSTVFDVVGKSLNLTTSISMRVVYPGQSEQGTHALQLLNDTVRCTCRSPVSTGVTAMVCAGCEPYRTWVFLRVHGGQTSIQLPNGLRWPEGRRYIVPIFFRSSFSRLALLLS